MDEKERIFIIIDGNNFYHRLKELKLTNLLSFDYEKITRFLVGRRFLMSKNYYIGAIREEHNNPKSKELMTGQQKLTGILQRDGWIVKFGHMLKTDGYHEKGVDVQIAVDLLIGAYENLYDTAILVSSDTDLIPALAKVRSMKKKVEYIGFSHKPSYGLITHSDIRRLLTKEDINQFL
ncbi:MAG: NYN domain-containing protein [Candidatus Giovannonibacteria bacterium]|nr:MAG: NYN domain-containing protein [Candidatus Giovannonibacteria bacterium]